MRSEVGSADGFRAVAPSPTARLPGDRAALGSRRTPCIGRVAGYHRGQVMSSSSPPVRRSMRGRIDRARSAFLQDHPDSATREDALFLFEEIESTRLVPSCRRAASDPAKNDGGLSVVD